MDDALDQELDRISGDPRIARAIKDSLQQLKGGGAGPELADMARDLLEERTDLRTVSNSSTFSALLTTAMSTYERWFNELTPEQRQQLNSDPRKYLASRDGE